jgi:hypothetical protein
MTIGSSPNIFSLSITGTIESSHIPNTDNLYCKFGLNYGPDWSILTVKQGKLTQGARRGYLPTLETTGSQGIHPNRRYPPVCVELSHRRGV